MDGHRAAAALRVGRDADQDELRRAFRARAKELHPDTGLHGSESAFIGLREAFDHLMATAPEAARSSSGPRSHEPGPPRHRHSTRGFDVPQPRLDRTAVDLTDEQRIRPRFTSPGRPLDREQDERGRRFAALLATARATAMAG